jgi:hypothetical protein
MKTLFLGSLIAVLFTMSLNDSKKKSTDHGQGMPEMNGFGSWELRFI